MCGARWDQDRRRAMYSLLVMIQEMIWRVYR